MKLGLKDLREIKEDYYQIDSQIINGDVWILFEHELLGEEVKCIAVNLTKKYYTYTDESLAYTVDNLNDEYEIYSL